MRIFPSIEGEPRLDLVYRRFPHTLAPLLELHDRALRDPSPLKVAERELIAAYVSGLNSCIFCHGAHVVAAKAFGIDEEVFEGLLADVATSKVDDRMKPILVYVGKLTLSPSRIVTSDAEAVYAAGWDEQALFDAISVCALFNYMNRIIEGSGIKSDPLKADAEEMDARIKRMGARTDDPHRGERTYSRLLQTWGISS